MCVSVTGLRSTASADRGPQIPLPYASGSNIRAGELISAAGFSGSRQVSVVNGEHQRPSHWVITSVIGGLRNVRNVRNVRGRGRCAGYRYRHILPMAPHPARTV